MVPREPEPTDADMEDVTVSEPLFQSIEEPNDPMDGASGLGSMTEAASAKLSALSAYPGLLGAP